MGDRVIYNGIPQSPGTDPVYKNRHVRDSILQLPCLNKTWKIVLTLTIGIIITFLVIVLVSLALMQPPSTNNQFNPTYSTVNVENTSAATGTLMQTQPTSTQLKSAYSTANVENTSESTITG